MIQKNHPVKAIMDLSCILHRMIEKQMADLGLSSIQSRVLGYLYFQSAHGRQVFQSELEEEFKIRKSSVTSVLQMLEKKGLVDRIGVREDARRKELLLTEQGVAVQETVLSRLEVLEHQINDLILPEERQIFDRCLERIETRLKEAENG